MSNGLLLDLILGAVLLISFIVGYKRGIFKAVIGLVVTAASLFGAVILSAPVSVPVAEFLLPYIQDSAGGLLAGFATLKYSAAGMSDSISQLLSKIDFSGIDLKSLNLQGIDLSKLDLSSVDLSGLASQSTVTELDVAAASMKLILPVVRALCGIIIFILLLLLLKLVARLINKLVTHTPLIRGANAILGGVFGLLEISVLLLVITLVLGKIGIPEAWASFTGGSFLYGVMSDFAPKLFPTLLSVVPSFTKK